MQPFDAISRLEDAERLDPLAGKVSALAGKALRSQRVRDALHGVWLGHPLHPALVQLPIGMWLSAGLLDLVPGTGPAAAALVATGTAAALPAAAAGWADWHALHPEQQRVGLVHAGANLLAVGVYAGSLAARLRGRTGLGKALAATGLSIASTGGLLGGHLAYRQAAGANHTEQVPHVIATGWQWIAAFEDLPDGAPVRRLLGSVPLLVVRRGPEVHALADECSHLSGPLHEGQLLDGTDPCIVCPWHGSTFHLRDGAVAAGPATAPQPVLQTRVQRGQVEVMLEGAG